MVFVGLAGVLLHYGHFERRFILAFGSVIIVGLGSAAFHGTLLFELQVRCYARATILIFYPRR
jgi:dihydroceramidase